MNRLADPAGSTRLALAFATLAVLAGCAGLRSDGPPANPPPDLVKVPDADPRLEPIRDGGPNKPYQALGQLYVPMREDKPFNERGLASWYGRKFQGKPTSSGEPYDMYAMTAAHRTMPIPSYARVRNPGNGREVVVRINDRGPFHSTRVIDLSYTAALKLGVLNGVAPVELTRITFEDIRTGAWRRPGSVDGLANVSAVTASPAIASTSTLAAPASATAVSPTPLAPLPPPISAKVPAIDDAGRVRAPSTRVTAAEPPSADSSGPQSIVATTEPASTNAAQGAASPVAESGAAPSSMPSGPALSDSAAEAVVPGAGFWVQLGAFKQQAGAEAFHRRVAADLAWLAPILTVAGDSGLFRLQAGPYAARREAQDVSQRIRDSLRLVPVIVDRR